MTAPKAGHDPYMLRTVISGGQTGADRTALECARLLGLETGGTVPRGWLTDDGPDPSLAEFGCEESCSPAYPPRTRANVLASDATVWFGRTDSRGYGLTRRLCRDFDRPFIENPDRIPWTYRILNVAGNRLRGNPEVVALVCAAFRVNPAMLPRGK